LGGLCGGVLEWANQPGIYARFFGPQDPKEVETEKEMQKILNSGPAYRVIDRGKDILDIAICLAMMVSGFGLLKMKTWGRSLAIITAVISIAVGLIFVFYALTFTVPAVYQFTESKQPANIDEYIDLSFLKFQAIAPIFNEMVFMIYPVIVLLVMMRSSVSAAFRPGLDQAE
jgi:hypothetical protein